jgi:hypothetical protein
LQPNYAGRYNNAFVARLRADGSALVYSTYLGGSLIDSGWGVAVDPATGDALVTGQTGSTDFPTVNGLQNYGGGNGDAFVARLTSDGSALVFSTYLGGSRGDGGRGIGVDPATGDIVVAGVTSSPNFPTVDPLQSSYGGGRLDAFVTRLNGAGSQLLFSSYLGGNGIDYGWGLAVDPTTGDALVTGETRSRDFPIVNALQSNYGGGIDDAFVTRISF